MNTIKKYYWTLCVIGVFKISSFGQSANTSPIFRIDKDTVGLSSVEKYIIKNPSIPMYLGFQIQKKYDNSELYKSLCTQGESFIKFDIEFNGKINNVIPLKGTSPLLTKILKKEIELTEGYWVFPKGETKKYTLVLPLKYEYQMGCSTGLQNKKIGIDKMPMPTQKSKFEDGTRLKDYDNFLESFIHYETNCQF